MKKKLNILFTILICIFLHFPLIFKDLLKWFDFSKIKVTVCFNFFNFSSLHN